jgi:hypothetical protein
MKTVTLGNAHPTRQRVILRAAARRMTIVVGLDQKIP